MIGYLDSRKASYFQKNELTKDEKKAYNKRCTRNKKIFCAAGIILNVGMLAFTKYFNFVGESVSAITGARLILSFLLEFPFTLSNLRGISSMYTAECMSRRKIR